MAYCLVWSKSEDNDKRPRLPGGFRTLKDARECAYANVVANHPIEIEGSRSGEVIKKAKGIVYSEKTTRSGTTRQYVLQDGSLSKTKAPVKSVTKPKSKTPSKTSPKTKTEPKTSPKTKTEPKKKRKYGEILGDAVVHFGSGFLSSL